MHKTQVLLVVILALALVAPGSSQAWEKERGPNFTYAGVFADTLEDGTVLCSGGHGVAVDNMDNVWVGNYYAGNTNGIVVLDAEGNLVKTVAEVVFADTTFDLVMTNGCRGINTDNDGNILYCSGASLIQINAETGMGMNYWVHPDGSSLTKPAVDAEGYIYVGKVVGIGPVQVIDPATFETTQEITLNPAPSYGRGIEITPDGKTLISSNLTDGGPIFIYTSDDYVTYTLSDSVFLNNVGNPVFKNQTVTMDWAPDGKLWVSHDAAYGGRGNTDNGFVAVDLENKKYSYQYIPMDSTEFNGPRGVAFNSTGTVAYAPSFNANKVYSFNMVELMSPVSDYMFDDALTNWNFEGVFADTTEDGTVLCSGGHGMAVDNMDNVWVGNYYAGNTNGLVVLDSDGNLVKTISEVVFDDTTFNLVMTSGCRGMNTDNDGNILYCNGASLIQINPETGMGMNYWVHPDGASLTKPAVDAEGFIYVGKVVGIGPVQVIDPATFQTTQEITLNPSASYGRGIEVSPDGKTLISSNLTDGGPVFIYTSEDYVTYTLSDSLFIDAGGYPVFLYQTVTMDWGPMGNLWISHDAAYGGNGQKYNGFVVVDLENKKYDWVTIALDTTEFNGPRGIAFNTAGDMAYTCGFNSNKVWAFSSKAVGVEIRPTAVVPKEFSLGHNYPNPFNPSTIIPFTLKNAAKVELKVYDILGREVQTLINRHMEFGSYNAVFDGRGMASGVYLYALKVDGRIMTKRMLLVK